MTQLHVNRSGMKPTDIVIDNTPVPLEEIHALLAEQAAPCLDHHQLPKRKQVILFDGADAPCMVTLYRQHGNTFRVKAPGSFTRTVHGSELQGRLYAPELFLLLASQWIVQCQKDISSMLARR